jgi:hypothetical protein
VDDAITRIDQRFDAVDRRFDTVDHSFERVFSELATMRGELLALHRQFAQAGGVLAGAVFVQLIALVVTVSVR